MELIILVGGSIIVVLTVLVIVSGFSMERQPRRTGIPRRSVRGMLGLTLVGLIACACSGLFLGGPELRQELARRRQVASATQPASAMVESHQCLFALEADTVVVYTFPAPDPVTGRARTYRQRETLRTRGKATCTPRSVPYALPIWYDPADPQRVTAQPLVASDLTMPLLLVSFFGGCFGLLPLAVAAGGLWAIMRRKRPAEQQLIADVRLMEADGYMIALEPYIREAVEAAQRNRAMAPYVRHLNGHWYVSFDFIADPTVRTATWNAFWRVQSNGWHLDTDQRRVNAVLEQLRGQADRPRG
jgi:hypothetical protein